MLHATQFTGTAAAKHSGCLKAAAVTCRTVWAAYKMFAYAVAISLAAECVAHVVWGLGPGGKHEVLQQAAAQSACRTAR